MISETVSPRPIAKRSLGELIDHEQRRKKRRRLGALGAAIVLATGGAVLGVQLRPKPLPLAERFRAEPVTRGDVVAEVVATGNLEAVTTVQVGAEISGRISSVEADFNDPVQRGQVLAHFDRASLDAQRAQSRAALAGARANLALSVTDQLRTQRDHERAEALFRTNTISEAVRDERRAAAQLALERVDAARAELAARRAAFELAQTNLSHATIHAPIDGVVITRSVDPGQTVASALQTPVLFTVAADLRAMRVIAAVDEADIGTVRASQPATFTVHAYPSRTFRATVTKVRSAPQTVHDVVTYGVELSVDNRDLALKPGMTASVHIVTDEAREALRIPVGALRFTPPGETRGRSPSAWILQEATLRRVEIAPSVSDGELVAVKASGLAPGMRVIVDLTPRGRSAYGTGH